MNQSVLVFGFSKNNPNCQQTWDPNQVLTDIYSQLYTAQFYYQLCSSIPPCTTPPDPPNGVDVYYVYQKCWKKEKTGGIIYYWPCNDNLDCYCMNIVTYCYQNGRWVVLWQTPYSYSCPSLYECDIPESQVQDPREGQTTSCFYLWTPCQ